MAAQVGAKSVLFRDDFSTNGKISGANWDFNHWQAVNNPAFNGNTNMRQALPEASGGVLHLKLDTFHKGNLNLNDRPTFLGDESITRQKFGLLNGQGVAFEFKARFVQDQGGIVGGMFPYAITGANIHDEIDFEALSSFQKKIYTNVYAGEPGGVGHVADRPLNTPLTAYHTYRIEWLPNAVRWLVDGQVVRVEKDHVPTDPMAVHLNIWAPLDAGWLGFDPNLKATRDAGQGKTYTFDVDYVNVERLASALGTNAVDKLAGTASNDWIEGAGGHDKLSGAQGHDRLLGGGGDDRLGGGAGADSLVGGGGEDDIVGGAGGDRLSGGAGSDTLTGGAGPDRLEGGVDADHFVFLAASDSPAGEARDTVADFSREEGDKLDLSRIDADAAAGGDQAFEFIGKKAFTGNAGELRFSVAEKGAVVSADVDGDGNADFEVFLAGVTSLKDADFIL